LFHFVSDKAEPRISNKGQPITNFWLLGVAPFQTIKSEAQGFTSSGKRSEENLSLVLWKGEKGYFLKNGNGIRIPQTGLVY